MSEVSRDKAVEEALKKAEAWVSKWWAPGFPAKVIRFSDPDREAVKSLIARAILLAQEAEREACAKAVCGYCKRTEDYEPARETENVGWQHARRRDGLDFDCEAYAIWAIRNRSARASEEGGRCPAREPGMAHVIPVGTSKCVLCDAPARAPESVVERTEGR